MERHRNRHAQILALAREDRVRRDLDRRSKPRHAQDRAFFHAGRHLDLDAPAPWQLNGPAGAGVELGEADRDRQFHVDWLLANTAARVAEDRAEDIAETTALAEEILHFLGAHVPVLDAGAWSRTALGAKAPGARLDTRRCGAGPVLPELVVELSLLRVRQHLVRFGDLLEARLGLLVPRIQVGVVLARELAEGGRDLFLRRPTRNAEHVVEVLGLRHSVFLLPACGARRIQAGARNRASR